MLLSKSAEYGIRAVLSLASREGEDYVPVRELSEGLAVSFHFLTKILQKLTEVGILESQRGPRGGVRLRLAPAEITIYDVVVAVDGADLFRKCVLGLPGCGDERPCPLHDAWAKERERLKRMFMSSSLDAVAERISDQGLRLK